MSRRSRKRMRQAWWKSPCQRKHRPHTRPRRCVPGMRGNPVHTCALLAEPRQRVLRPCVRPRPRYCGRPRRVAVRGHCALPAAPDPVAVRVSVRLDAMHLFRVDTAQRRGAGPAGASPPSSPRPPDTWLPSTRAPSSLLSTAGATVRCAGRPLRLTVVKGDCQRTVQGRMVFPRVYVLSGRLGPTFVEYHGGFRSWEMAASLSMFMDAPGTVTSISDVVETLSSGQVCLIDALSIDSGMADCRARLLSCGCRVARTGGPKADFQRGGHATAAGFVRRHCAHVSRAAGTPDVQVRFVASVVPSIGAWARLEPGQCAILFSTRSIEVVLRARSVPAHACSLLH